jgi:hypothetical protein
MAFVRGLTVALAAYAALTIARAWLDDIYG